MASSTSTSTPSSLVQPTLPPDWNKYYDSTNDRHYYYNSKTKVSTWESPFHNRSRSPVVQHSLSIDESSFSARRVSKSISAKVSYAAASFRTRFFFLLYFSIGFVCMWFFFNFFLGGGGRAALSLPESENAIVVSSLFLLYTPQPTDLMSSSARQLLLWMHPLSYRLPSSMHFAQSPSCSPSLSQTSSCKWSTQ